jgi:hypothetical protein
MSVTEADRASSAAPSLEDNQWGDPPAIPRRQKTGGRRKGTPNKKTVERARVMADLHFSGKDPVTFFAEILRNERAPLDLRFAAAKELAPFMHPKLASIEARTGGKTHEDRLEELQRMANEDEG